MGDRSFGEMGRSGFLSERSETRVAPARTPRARSQDHGVMDGDVFQL
jgi:hypothetical protein